MGFIITATALANTFAAIFQCSPVHAAWQGSGSDDARQAKCLNMAAFDEYMAIPNVITGAVMILMPLPPVLRLNVATLQKIALSATFLHGAMYDHPLPLLPTQELPLLLLTQSFQWPLRLLRPTLHSLSSLLPFVFFLPHHNNNLHHQRTRQLYNSGLPPHSSSHLRCHPARAPFRLVPPARVS